MPSLKIKNFKFGLDARKSEVEAQAGTLVELTNAHINQGGEVEKRKAFVRTAVSASAFGAQPTASGIATFGSDADPGGWAAVSATVGKTVYYQRLQHPAVLAGTVYNASLHAMDRVVFSDTFGGYAFVVAKFADGYTFAYYNGTLVPDFVAGLVLPYLAGSNTLIATHMMGAVNNTENYTATNPAPGIIDIDGPVGQDYSIAHSTTSALGTVTGPTNTVTAVKAVAGASAVGSFTITGGTDNGVALAAGTANVVRTASNATAGDWVQVGKKKYTFRSTLAAEGDVKIGATALDSQTNLMNAINHGTGSGTTYIAALPHPWARAGAIAGNNLPITAFSGSQAVALLISSAGGTPWTVSAATLAGGAGNAVSSIKVVSPTGSEVELLPLSGGAPVAVRFTTNAQATAALVRDAIVSNVLVSGYTATVNENTVTILSSTSASPMPNGYHVQVACGGDVLIGECLFYLSMINPSFTLSSIVVDGLDLFGGSPATYTNPTATGAWNGTNPLQQVDNLTEYYFELVTFINRRSGVTGINAWSNGQYVKLSKISTRDDDQPLVVYVTPGAALQNVGVVFGNPPDLALPLAVSLPERVSVAATTAEFMYSGSVTNPQPPLLALTGLVVPTITGGNGAFSYEWLMEYANLAAGQVSVSVNGSSSLRTYNITLSPTGAQNVTVSLIIAGFSGTNWAINVGPLVVNFPVRVRITDSFGNKALSEPCIVQFQVL